MDLKLVKRPERTVVVRNKGIKYVYLTQCVEYSKEKKVSRPSRIAIGKLNEEGLLILNANYIRLVK